MDDRDGLIMSACLRICEAIWGSDSDVKKATERFIPSDMISVALLYHETVQPLFRIAKMARQQ